MQKLLIVVFAILSIEASGQQYKYMMDDLNINYYDVVDSASSYFKNIDLSQKGTGYKEFLRWQYLNESKYAPSGQRNLVSPYFVSEEFKKFIQQSKKTRSLNTDWRSLGPENIDTITGHYAVGLGRIEDVYVHASNVNIIYAGTRSGGFWKSVNAGASWQSKFTDTLFATGVNAITASPTNPDSILINVRNSLNGTSHGIYRSINGGSVWTKTNFNPTILGAGGLGSNFQIFKIFYHPTISDLIFIGTSQGLYRSADNLSSWTHVYTSGRITQIQFHPTDPNILYIYDDASGGSNENKILHSTNMGLSFTPSSAMNNLGATMYISASAQAPNNVYVASNNGLWKSMDSGKNFILISTPGITAKGFAVNTYDTNKIVHGYVDLSNSTDGGLTFSQCTWWSLGSSQHNGTGTNASAFINSKNYVHADMNILRCVNGVFYGGSDGYVVKSADNGATWTRLAEGMSIRENYCVGTSQSNHYVSICGSQDNGESIVNEKGWIEFYGADGMEGLVAPLNDEWLLGSVQYGNRRLTKDGGWTQQGASAPVSDGVWITPILLDPNHQLRLYDFTDSIYVTEDFGEHWTYRGKLSVAGNINEAAIAINNSNIMAVSRDANIFKSIDGGITWTNIKNNLPTATITSITFDPKDDQVIVVTYDRYQDDGKKIYQTIDGGATWNNITYNLGNMPIHCAIIDHTPEKNMYVGAEIGLYVKAMKDTVWTLHGNALPNMTVRDLEINWGSNTLKAATWGRGLWENSLKGRSTYPAIVKTQITNPPTLELPKAGIAQYVTSSIHYTGILTKVYLMYGLDTNHLTQKIDMLYLSDSSYKSAQPLPSDTNDLIYFKVFAVGAANDTSETYRFMYKVQPLIHCEALGYNDGGNLHINNVELASLNNATINDTYTFYSQPIINLYPSTIYTLTVSASTGWTENDFGAWIDFNGDSYFDKVTERVLFAPNNGATASSTFSLPASYNGYDNLRMRVRLSYWGNSPDPCGETLGEVEDYTIRANYPAVLEPISKIDLDIYPNPTNQKVTISGEFLKNNSITIYNLDGQIVKEYNTLSDSITLDVHDLSSGLYLIKCGNLKGTFIKE